MRDLGCNLYHTEKILTHPTPPGLTKLLLYIQDLTFSRAFGGWRILCAYLKRNTPARKKDMRAHLMTAHTGTQFRHGEAKVTRMLQMSRALVRQLVLGAGHVRLRSKVVHTTRSVFLTERFGPSPEWNAHVWRLARPMAATTLLRADRPIGSAAVLSGVAGLRWRQRHMGAGGCVCGQFVGV